MSVKVALRNKKISKNRLALYLDFYPAVIYPSDIDKPTRRHFLNRYLFADEFIDENGKTKRIRLSAIEKIHNQDTFLWAETMRQKVDSIINKPEIYTELERQQLIFNKRGEQNFIEYFQKLKDKKNDGNWKSTYHYLNDYCEGYVKFSSLNAEFCEDFKEYLLAVPSRKSPKVTLKKNSAKSYFEKFKSALKQAYKHEYLQTDVNSKVTSISEEETQREYLDTNELNRLAQAECESDVVKNAGLFAALTGLRFSDIEKLVWSEVTNLNNEGYTLRFIQQKTKGAETMPISVDTFKFLGEKKGGGDKVFEGLKYKDCVAKSSIFSNWLKNAGIYKPFTFHCFRHTFAVLQLLNGTDIYTLKKMMGHRNIRTTEIYARVADEKKREASERVKLNESSNLPK